MSVPWLLGNRVYKACAHPPDPTTVGVVVSGGFGNTIMANPNNWRAWVFVTTTTNY